MTHRSAFCVAVCVVAGCASAPPAPPSPRGAPPTQPSAPAASAPRAPTPSATGIWLGRLGNTENGLLLQLRLDLHKTPPECALDSLDQRHTGIPCGDVKTTGAELSLAVPAVRGALSGRLSDDGETLSATWTQHGATTPIVLTRQERIRAVTMDAALPPVSVADLKAVLDKDLAASLERGELAKGSDAGLAIGVVRGGERRVLTYGTAKDDSVFEIGSITKTFTGLLLAQMVNQKKVRIDDPLRALLPPGTVDAPASGAEITLLDLSTHHSGLPRLPDNLKPAREDDPYAEYDRKALYAFVATHGVARPEPAAFAYSNLGAALLGQALAERAGTSYEALVRKEITGPLGMRDTVITLTPALRARLIAGRDAERRPARPWDLNAFVGAGGLRSTASDMLTYLEAELHPERLPASSRTTPEGKTLGDAITASQAVRADAEGGMHVALNWLRMDETGSYWHNGGTGGYSAFAIFNREKDFAVVVLFNTSPGSRSFADDVGAHVAQRLAGQPAIPL